MPIQTLQQGEQQLDVDRLGDIVGRAGIEAFLAVALHRLGGDRDQRQVGERRLRADLLHRLVAVHLRHHDVDQGDVDAGRLLEDEDAVAAALGVEHLDVVALEHAGQRVDVADVVVDDEDLGAGQLGQRARLGRRVLAAPVRPRWRLRRGLRLGSRIRLKTLASSSWSAGLPVTPKAPMLGHRVETSSAPEMTWIGMSPVSASCLSRSSRTKPSMSSRPRSSVIASGWSLRASASVPAPAVETTPLRPASRARSSRIEAKVDVVLDDQDERVAAEIVAVVADLERRRQRRRDGGAAILVARGGRRAGSARRRRRPRAARTG